jgi:hypothetical protein
MGFFPFDESKYASKLRDMSIPELLYREKDKYRATVSGAAGVGAGIGLVAFTAGTSLLGSAIGGRRWDVASQKLEMVQRELMARGEPLCDPTKRDVLIPMAVSLCTMGIGHGMEIAVASHATNAFAGSIAGNVAGDLTTTGSRYALHEAQKIEIEGNIGDGGRYNERYSTAPSDWRSRPGYIAASTLTSSPLSYRQSHVRRGHSQQDYKVEKRVTEYRPSFVQYRPELQHAQKLRTLTFVLAGIIAVAMVM